MICNYRIVYVDGGGRWLGCSGDKEFSLGDTYLVRYEGWQVGLVGPGEDRVFRWVIWIYRIPPLPPLAFSTASHQNNTLCATWLFSFTMFVDRGSQVRRGSRQSGVDYRDNGPRRLLFGRVSPRKRLPSSWHNKKVKQLQYR